MLGRLRWHEDGRIEAGFVPVHVEAPGRPVIADAPQAAAITSYMTRITQDAGLPPLSFRPGDGMMGMAVMRQRRDLAEIWLFYLGAAALLFAVAVDAIAVIGRHIGKPLLGSIELMQAAILIAASAAIVSATMVDKHAVVHLLIDRLSPRMRLIMGRVHAALCAWCFFIALAAGSIWIALDLRGGNEESELLHIPYAPLRVVSIVATCWRWRSSTPCG